MSFLPLLVVALPVTATSGESVVAEFNYAGPASLDGQFVGSCEGNGVYLAPGVPRSLLVESGGGSLTVVHTRVNYTIVSPEASPAYMPDADNQWSEQIDVPAGAARIQVGPTGIVTVVPPFDGREFGQPFAVSIVLDSADFSSVREGIRTPGEFFWVASEPGAKPHIQDFTFPRPDRTVSFDGEATAEGTLLLYLREATVTFREERLRLEPWTVEEFNATTPAIARRTVIFNDAFLELDDARLVAPSDAQIVCGGSEGRIEGAFVADRATGRATGAGKDVTFEEKVLSMEGTFVLEERPETSSTGQDVVRSRAEGSIAVLGVDFAPALTSPSPILESATTVALWLLVMGAVLLGLKNLGTFVGAFYSRFGRDRVLDNPSRDLVYQAVMQNPGIALSRLTQVTPYHLSTVTYHVRVLQRVGLIGTLRHGRSIRVLPRTMMTSATLPRLKQVWDPRIAFVVDQVHAEPKALKQVVQTLSANFAITAQASYAIVKGAVEANLVRRTGSGKGVMVECVPESS